MKYAALLLLASCGLPSVSDVTLAECISGLGVTRDTCTAKARTKATVCAYKAITDSDLFLCADELVTAEDKCWANYADSVTDCIRQTEQQLKQ